MSLSMNNQTFKQEHEQLLNEKHQQTIQNIQDLQDLEKYMFQNLEKISSNDSPNVQQQQHIVAKIKELTNIRKGLFAQLQQMYNSTNSEIMEDRNDLASQMTTLQVVENQLKQMENSLQNIKQEEQDKLRMIEIGNYEFERYQAHKQLLQMLGLFSGIFLTLLVFMKKEIIPNTIGSGLISIVAIVGLFFIIRKLYNIYSRSSFVWNEYNWQNVPPSQVSSGETVFQHDKKFFGKLLNETETGLDNLKGKAEQTYSSLTKKGESMIQKARNQVESGISKAEGDATKLTKQAFQKESIQNPDQTTNMVQPSEGKMVENFLVFSN